MYYHSGTSFFIGGLHHAAARISGDNVYKHLKYEGGIHRVQRIPEVGLSSRMQRIHTGTMSVIVLPHPDEVTPCRNPVPLSVKIHRSFTVHEKLLCILLTECFCTPNMWTSFPHEAVPPFSVDKWLSYSSAHVWHRLPGEVPQAGLSPIGQPPQPHQSQTWDQAVSCAPASGGSRDPLLSLSNLLKGLKNTGKQCPY